MWPIEIGKELSVFSELLGVDAGEVRLFCPLLCAQQGGAVRLCRLDASLLECLDCGEDAYAVADGGDAHLLECILIYVEEDVSGNVVACERRGVVGEAMGGEPGLDLGVAPLPNLLEGDAAHACGGKTDGK